MKKEIIKINIPNHNNRIKNLISKKTIYRIFLILFFFLPFVAYGGKKSSEDDQTKHVVLKVIEKFDEEKARKFIRKVNEEKATQKQIANVLGTGRSPKISAPRISEFLNNKKGTPFQRKSARNIVEALKSYIESHENLFGITLADLEAELEPTLVTEPLKYQIQPNQLQKLQKSSTSERQSSTDGKVEADLAFARDPLRKPLKNLEINSKQEIEINSWFQISVKAVVFSKVEHKLASEPRRYDYFHIAQDGWFNPGEELGEYHGWCGLTSCCCSQPILASKYVMGAYPLKRILPPKEEERKTFKGKKFWQFTSKKKSSPKTENNKASNDGTNGPSKGKKSSFLKNENNGSSKAETSVTSKDKESKQPIDEEDEIPEGFVSFNSSNLDHDVLYLVGSSPDTSIGKTSYTSGLEIGMSLNGGASGILPTANAETHANISHTKTRDLEDINVKNKSLAKGNDAKWEFGINNLNRKLKKTSLVSISTCHPYVQWIWRVDHNAAKEAGLYYKEQNNPDGPWYFTFYNYVRVQFTFARGCLRGVCCLGTNTSKHSKEVRVIKESIKITVPDELEKPEHHLQTNLIQEKEPDTQLKDEEDSLRTYDFNSLNIPLKEDISLLPVRNTFFDPVGKLQGNYQADGKTFNRQNVSGRHLNCFFNATGLKIEEEIEKLNSRSNDPIVRYMIANEIVSAAANPEQLSRKVKNAINYAFYESQWKKLESEEEASTLGENNNQQENKSLLAIGKESQDILEELRERALSLNAFTAFINYQVRSLDMMSTIQSMLGEEGDNPNTNYASIDAIAYINKLGIKIYQPQQTKSKNKGLHLIHEFIPLEATEIAYLYHDESHFQSLILKE